ncbi:MAG: ribonuclease catalytic domain-containing protein [Desulfocapsaceae bacterium]|nr:ribonuclease catalytic domain-containing protein [Desulfocapsaceae bacterium]
MISTGKIIEYLDNGKFICGFITELQQKRVHLINQNKREVKLPLSRIIHCSLNSHAVDTNRDSLVRILLDTNQNRNSLMEEIDLKEIWELISEENNDSFDPAFLAELVFGKEADDDLVSALLRSIFINKIYFRYKEGRVKVHSPEQVEALEKEAIRLRKRKQLIDKGSAILRSIKEKNTTSVINPEELENCLHIIKEYYLFGNDAQYSQVAKEILKEAGLNRPHDAFHILVDAGVWSENENIPLLRSNIVVNFSRPAIQQAEMVLQSSVSTLFQDPARKDFTHLSPITVDGATTLDFDDALTIEKKEEGYLVGIHISDVSNYVKPGDALFQEAMYRGTSIYFPESQIPMLPRHLSQGICSLIQGEIRAAMSFMILLSEEAEVLRVRIYPSIIKVARRLTYEEADALIESDGELSTLINLSKKLRRNRLDAGALLLPFPDVNIHIDSHGKVHVSLGATDTPSRTLVSEMMILANQEAARYVSDRLAPGLFRAQDPPKQHLVHGEDNDLFINTRQRKQLSRGELLTVAKKHSGLGVNQYTTVTSPIRRLLDLVMQHQLQSLIRREEPRFTAEMCKDFVAIITRTLTTANVVKQQRHQYWLLVYLKDRVGQYLDALVIESGPKRVMMLLKDILFDFDLPTPAGNKPSPGETVKVKVMKSDPLDNVVRFDWG